MMKYFLCSVFLFLLWPHSAQAAITPKNSVMCRVSTTGNQTCAGPALTVAAGDTIMLFANTPTSYNDTYGISDSCTQTWTPGNAAGSGQYVRWWYVLSATAGSCVITMTHTVGANETWGGFVATSYSGVTGIKANSGIVSTTSITNCSGFLQLTGAGNYLVGGFGMNNGSNGTGFTPTSGTIRVQASSSYVIALLDNTASVVGNLSMGVSWTGNTGRCSYVIVELNAATPPPALVLTPPPCGGGILGLAYSCILTASGGVTPYTWSITSGNLPSGLTLSSTGTISGTPSAAGSFSPTVQVADSATPTASTQTATVAITITGRMAVSSDALHDILLASAGNNSYVLPGTILGSQNDFCAWVIPTGSTSNTYDIIAQSTQLNGQGADIVVPSWQMSRVCQDSTGNYWVNPPLIAGNGVTITSGPRSVVIAATTPTGGAITKIAGGTTTLGDGATAIPSNTCTTGSFPGGNVSAPGVVATDVVTESRQSTGSGWGNGSLIIFPQAFTGSVFFAVCNSAANSITPSALPVNWLVVR